MAIYTTIQPVEERHSGLFFEDSAIVLREEQEEAIDKAFRYFKKKNNIITKQKMKGLCPPF